MLFVRRQFRIIGSKEIERNVLKYMYIHAKKKKNDYLRGGGTKPEDELGWGIVG